MERRGGQEEHVQGESSVTAFSKGQRSLTCVRCHRKSIPAHGNDRIKQT